MMILKSGLKRNERVRNTPAIAKVRETANAPQVKIRSLYNIARAWERVGDVPSAILFPSGPPQNCLCTLCIATHEGNLEVHHHVADG